MQTRRMRSNGNYNIINQVIIASVDVNTTVQQQRYLVGHGTRIHLLTAHTFDTDKPGLFSLTFSLFLQFVYVIKNSVFWYMFYLILFKPFRLV